MPISVLFCLAGGMEEEKSFPGLFFHLLSPWNFSYHFLGAMPTATPIRPPTIHR